MGGAFFEGFIVIEAWKALMNSGTNAELYFWRSHDGMEIDLIIETGGRLHAIEIKKTKTPTPRHGETLKKFMSLAGNKAGKSMVVCTCDSEIPLSSTITAVPWQTFLKKPGQI